MEAVALVVLAFGYLLAVTSPAAGTVDLRIAGVSEGSQDGYGRTAVAGRAFVFVRMNVTNRLGQALVVDNGSVTLWAGPASYPGTVTPPGSVSVAPGGTAPVTAGFEVPHGTVTQEIWLSEGSASATAPFVYRTATPAAYADLRVAGISESGSDGWGRVPGTGNVFLIVSAQVASHLVATVTLGNTSFTLVAVAGSYGGAVSPPGQVAVAPGETELLAVAFEVPQGETTQKLVLSEGAAVAEALFAYTVSTGSPGPATIALIISVSADGTNWSVVIASVSSGLLPSTTYLLTRNSLGVIVLARTPFSAFTPASWGVYHVLFQDANPAAPDLRPGDGLLLSRAVYPSGTTIEISTSSGVLTSRMLM